MGLGIYSPKWYALVEAGTLIGLRTGYFIMPANPHNLNSRASALLGGPCCFSQGDGPIIELIRRYAAGEPWKDPELRRILSACIEKANAKGANAQEATGPARDAGLFYQKAAGILEAIQAEVLAGRLY